MTAQATKLVPWEQVPDGPADRTDDLAGELAGPIAEIAGLPGELTAVTFSLVIRGRRFDVVYLPGRQEPWSAFTADIRNGVAMPDDIEGFGETALQALRDCVAEAQAAATLEPTKGTRCERGECVDCWYRPPTPALAT